MFNNSHFALATHALAAMALNPGQPISSAELAKSMGTNAAFLRTVLGRLKDAGLVNVALGKGGGARLAVPADQLTLWEVYEAVTGDERSKGLHQCDPSGKCLVGQALEIDGPAVVNIVLRGAHQATVKPASVRSVSNAAVEPTMPRCDV